MPELFQVAESQFVKEAGVVVVSTSAAAPTVVAQLDYTIKEDGDYMLGYAFQADFNGTKDKLLQFREVHNGGTPDAWFSLSAPSAAGDHRNRMYGYPKTLTAGAKTFALEMFKDATIAQMDIDFVDIIVQRIG